VILTGGTSEAYTRQSWMILKVLTVPAQPHLTDLELAVLISGRVPEVFDTPVVPDMYMLTPN